MGNRVGNPSDVKKNMKMKLHEIRSYRSGNKSQAVVGWKDKRVVLVMTSYFDNAVEDVSHITTNGTETFSKPTAIIQYTKVKKKDAGVAISRCSQLHFQRGMGPLHHVI